VCRRRPVISSSASTRTPTSMDVRPAKLTLDFMTTRSPRWIGSRKSTRSIDAVTTGARQCRNAEMAAHLSIIDMITPPKTCPMLFASPGIISSEVSCWLSLTGLVDRGTTGRVVDVRCRISDIGMTVLAWTRDCRPVSGPKNRASTVKTSAWQIYCVLNVRMRPFIHSFLVLGLLVATGCKAADSDPAPIPVSAAKPVDTTATASVADGAIEPKREAAPLAARPLALRQPTAADSAVRAMTVIRALYANRSAAQSRKKMRQLIAIADTTEINALVLDMKDEFGLNYRTSNPEFARNAGNAGSVPNLRELLDTLKAHGILPIARLVVFKDSVTARVHPEWTIRNADGSAWRDKEGLAWVNPYQRGLWDYNIGIARELVNLGFGEIQFDYIRFPEPYKSLPPQNFPDSKGMSKPDVLAGFLKEAKTKLNALGVRSTADVFGLVTTVKGPLEIGQWWEKVSPVSDVLLPMVYPSHYPRGSFGVDRPNAEPYRILKTAIDTARVRDEKLGITTPEHVRPWLQAFSLGKLKPVYGAEEIRQQKQAVYDAGYDGWVLWSPGSKYDAFLPALEKTLESRKKK
jgi:hypothetical protein